VIETLHSYINGVWTPGGEIALDENPARPGEHVAQVAIGNAELASHAVTAAADAGPAWAAAAAPGRADILRRTADILGERRDRIATDLVAEEGKTLPEALGETDRAVAILRYYAGQALEPDGETYPSHSADTLLFARRVPVGVLLAITPWNFPIAIPAWKIAPALAYGNTVVWKPAELVPLTATHFVRAFEDAGLPPGVLNLVLGRSSDVGNVLTDHPGVMAISFTGSNAVGRNIQMRAVGLGKRVQLELGGKNPAVVLADADLGRAAEQVARGAFLSAGQKCTATSRVIVAAEVLTEFQERLVALAESWAVGDPMEPTTRVGPLVSSGQLERVRGFVENAQRDGGRLLAGGTAALSGLDGQYLRPTVLSGVSSRASIAQDEVFGPVAVLLPAASEDEAISLANDTRFGLCASVFTQGLAQALRFAQECRVGIVKVNQETAGIEYQAPFGGMKDSSSGSREQGRAAREFMTEWKTVSIAP
jgi:aldehyde dehydrogenase (NAD+)